MSPFGRYCCKSLFDRRLSLVSFFCGKLAAAPFGTFATISALFGLPAVSNSSPQCATKRTSFNTMDLCVHALALGQFLQARDHRRVRIGQWGDRGKMVGGGKSAEPCREPGRAPGLDNAPALPKIFRAFVLAHHRIEASAQWRAPE